MTEGVRGTYVAFLLAGIFFFLIISYVLASWRPDSALQGVTRASNNRSSFCTDHAPWYGVVFCKTSILDTTVSSHLVNFAVQHPQRTKAITLLLDLLRAMALSFFTGSVLFFGLHIFQQFIYERSGGRQFDEFFGLGASRLSARGKVMLQAGDLEELTGSQLTFTSNMSSFKAREWTNRWDLEGVKAIRDAFHTNGLPVPDIYVAPTAEEKKADVNADKDARGQFGREEEPFVISLGMGFTHHINLKDYIKWFSIEEKGTGPYGDCLLLRTEFVPPFMTNLCPADKDAFVKELRQKAQPGKNPNAMANDVCLQNINDVGNISEEVQDLVRPQDSTLGGPTPAPDKANEERDLMEPNFVRILPKDWDISKWNEWEKRKSQYDYAIIYRQTHLVGDPRRPTQKTHFVIAGFTERGTAMGAKYIAEKWSELWETYVSEVAETLDNYGDFFLVLAGQYDKPQDWNKEIEITPASLPLGFDWKHVNLFRDGSVIASFDELKLRSKIKRLRRKLRRKLQKTSGASTKDTSRSAKRSSSNGSDVLNL